MWFLALCMLMFSIAACGSEAVKEDGPLPEPVREIIHITSTDGYVVNGRLVMPGGDGDVAGLVIFVNGSGPNTFLNKRHTPGTGFWNYYDFWAEEFVGIGAAFFSYSTRGVSDGIRPPLFMEIDDEAYKTYLPSNSVEDLYHIIRALRENPRLSGAEVMLLGASEGAIIASLFAETYPGMADVLLLFGYPNDNMYDVLRWQASGGPSMVWYRAHFETDGYGRVSRAAFEADPMGVVQNVLGGSAFEDIDANNDGFIDEQDLLIMLREAGATHLYDPEPMLAAIYRGDDAWLAENYGVLLTSGWFLEHFALRSNMEMLPELDIPIYIFHGYVDQNVDVAGVYQVYARFVELGKTNLTIHTFPGHDHNLNFTLAVFEGELSDGNQAIIDTVAARINKGAS